METTKILICTHKDFENPINSDAFKVIDARDLRGKIDLPLDDRFYSEFYQYKWALDNLELPDYVGTCHYRRYFSFMDEIPEMRKDKVIMPTPISFGESVREQYGRMHNIKDLELVEWIVHEKYPEYYDTMQEFLANDTFFTNNMFVMSKEKFKEFCDFYFTVMGEYLRIVGTDIMKRINDNKGDYLKTGMIPNDTAEYQYRIGGFMGERLTNTFILKNFEPSNIDTYELMMY